MVDSATIKHLEDRIFQGGFVLAGLAIALSCVNQFCRQMFDHALTPDWGWLYKTGLYILENRRLPSTDLFTWTHPEQPWVLYQWLFEALAAAGYRVAGQTTSVVLFTLLALGLYAVAPAAFLRRRGVPTILTLAIAGLVLLPVSTNLGLRPMIVTSALLLLQFVLVDRWRVYRLDTRRLTVYVMLMYGLWANMHMGVTLGLVSFGLFAVGEIIEGRTRRAGIMIGMGVAGFAASLVNPYGVEIYTYLFHLSLETKMNAHISELRPPDMRGMGFIVAGGLAIVFLLDIYRQRERYRAGDILHLIVFSVLTAFSLRFVVWAGLFYVLVVPAGLWQRINVGPDNIGNLRAGLRASRHADTTLLGSFCGACILLAAFVTPLSQSAKVHGCPPLRSAIKYLDAHYPPTTRWFSADVVGSCTRLYTPERKTFGDTRFDMLGESFVVEWVNTFNGREGWRNFLSKWNIDVLLLPKDRELASKLKGNTDYTIVFQDGHTYIFERR